MSEQTGQAPESDGTTRTSSGVAGHLLQGPILIPMLASALALGGVGWLGHYMLTEAPEGILEGRGVAVPDALIIPLAAGFGFLVVLIGTFAMASRLRVLLTIGARLIRFGRGERTAGAMRVADHAGVGRAWNELLAWAEERAEASEAAALLRSSGGSSNSAAERASDGLWHGVVVIDEQQLIRYANGAAAVFLRQRRDALPGVDIRRVITDTHVLEAIGVATRTGSRQRRVFDVGDPTAVDASVLRFSIRAIGQGSDRAALIVIEDVTQQRIADAVQHAFVAQATHELRTPLTNMRLYVEQLLGDDLTPEERGTAMNVVNQEITRLDHIVGDMLSIAELQAGGLSAKRGEVRMGPLLEQLRDDYAESARAKGLTLSFELPPKFPSVQGDRDKIGIVLHNLLGNAIKYTPSGGSVRLEVREEGDRLVMEVTDTGFGIGEEDAPKVFERFSRGSDPRAREQTGTGLGLALARDIARLHDGDITLHSEVNVGSTFSFWLPIGVHAPAKAA